MDSSAHLFANLRRAARKNFSSLIDDSLLFLQTILQARSSIEVDFQDICDDNSIIDKLHTLDIMCAQQGIVDGASEYVVFVFTN
jgi:hypothetical protein